MIFYSSFPYFYHVVYLFIIRWPCACEQDLLWMIPYEVCIYTGPIDKLVMCWLVNNLGTIDELDLMISNLELGFFFFFSKKTRFLFI